MIEGFTETPATSNEFSIVALYAHTCTHCDSGKLTEFSSLKDDVFFLRAHITTVTVSCALEA